MIFQLDTWAYHEKKVNLDKLTTQGVHFSQMDVGIQSRDVLAARASRQKGGIHVPRVDTRIRRARRISPDSRLLRHSSYDGPVSCAHQVPQAEPSLTKIK
jgi:hypothetical protein